MTLKQDYAAIFQEVEKLDGDMSGRLPMQKALLSVLVSIDKHLKSIDSKL